jgi:hypothetical protein
VAAASVLVIGAQGALGRVCVDALQSAGYVVTRGGRRREDAGDFRLVDLDVESGLADALAGFDLVVSTVRHPSHAAERTVLREGGLLLNVASLTASDRATLKAEAAGAKGLVVLHAGVAPGVYSLLFTDMLAEHPDADELEIACTFSMLQTSGRAAVRDFTFPVLTSARRHPTRKFVFRAPIGARRCMEVAGPECGFFGDVGTGRTARVYVGLLQRWAQAEFLMVNALGLWKVLPSSFFTAGSGWRAKRTTSEPRRDILAVKRDDEVLAACAVEFAGDYRATAVSTVAFAQSLLTRSASQPRVDGVQGAEEMFKLTDIRDGIERGGIHIVPLPPQTAG